MNYFSPNRLKKPCQRSKSKLYVDEIRREVRETERGKCDGKQREREIKSVMKDLCVCG